MILQVSDGSRHPRGLAATHAAGVAALGTGALETIQAGCVVGEVLRQGEHAGHAEEGLGGAVES